MSRLKYSVPIFVEQIYKMQRLEVSGAVRPLEGLLGFKGLMEDTKCVSKVDNNKKECTEVH